MTAPPSAAGPGLGRDRATIVTGGLLLVAAGLAWASVVGQATSAGGPAAPPTDVMAMSMGAMTMDGTAAPSDASGDAMGMTLMGPGPYLLAWAVMMAAMMLPSAAPMVALYGAVRRRATPGARSGVPTAAFALVYLLTWTVIGLPVYLASLGVGAFTSVEDAARLLPYGVALVLLAAGAYQFSRLKWTCLSACRSPLGFLMGRWDPGPLGSVRLGFAHALYCVGCCWALMAVLVAAGAMALHWVLLIAAAVAVEKLLPGGRRAAHAIGVALVGLALAVAVRPELALALSRAGA